MMTQKYKEKWCKNFVANKLMTLFESYCMSIPNYDEMEDAIVSMMMKTLARTKGRDIYYEDVLDAFKKAIIKVWNFNTEK